VRRHTKRTWLLGFVVATLLLASCDPYADDNDLSNTQDPCNVAAGVIDVSGPWRLEASGERDGCYDPRYDGDFDLEATRTLSVSQRSADDGAGYEDELYLFNPITGLTFSGRVLGSCVEFETTEFDRGERLHYFFSGKLEDFNSVRGRFFGDGPVGCQSDGGFKVGLVRNTPYPDLYSPDLGGDSEDAEVNELPDVSTVCNAVDLGSLTGHPVRRDSTADGSADYSATCAPTENSLELRYLWRAPIDGWYAFDTLGSPVDTVLSVLSGECGAEILCADDSIGLAPVVRLHLDADEQITLVAEGKDGARGRLVLNIQPSEADCRNKLDDDGDGRTDCNDLDCAVDALCAENCTDGVDNDGDGWSDCSDAQCVFLPMCDEDCGNAVDDNGNDLVDCADPLCADSLDCAEFDCADGNDNNADGAIDCADNACQSLAACAENCANALDDNGDGLLNCADPFCTTHPNCAEVCDDGRDNDRDGIFDCADADCVGHTLCGETDCTDTVDNDADGRTDCQDSECATTPGCFESDCSNNTDDDGDGLIDCLDLADCGHDPACGEALCGDGLDNDTDGRVDCRDVDCAAAPNCAETCDDSIDNNGNGLVDCADDACASASHCAEDCSDHLDNNGDDHIDCADLRCEALANCAEQACDDSVDDDGDGLVDCLDPDCARDVACVESLCDDAVDNDSDGATDCDDSDCAGTAACRETLCDDGTDNDGDGDGDCMDFDCADLPICRERVCDDGLDNEGDGLMDCGDLDCALNLVCGGDCPTKDLGGALGFKLACGSTKGAGADLIGTCGNTSDAEDVAYTWTAPFDGRYVFDTGGSGFDTVVYLLDGRCGGDEIGCDATMGPIAAVTATLLQGQEVTVVIDGWGRESGAYTLNIIPD